MNSLIIVVLFDCTIETSETLMTLSKSNLDLSSCKLVVWNNGPDYIDESRLIDYFDAKLNVTITQNITNEPLSFIYNKQIKDSVFDKILIFDHDTKVNDYYLLEAMKCTHLVGMPRIYSHGEFRSPRVNGIFKDSGFKHHEKAIGIGSGLLISCELIKSFEKIFGSVFDERFCLYGVDSSFFFRFYRHYSIKDIEILPKLCHSLSKLDNENNLISDFRNRERSYDLGLTARNYPSLINFIYFFKAILGSLIGRNQMKPKLMFKAFFSGIHPRCKKL